jgi:epoxyqueuosine reductase
MSSVLDLVSAAAAPFGLNLIAAIPAIRYDRVVPTKMRARTIDPEAHSIIVIGNGGGAFWRAFTEHAAQHSGWRDRQNPLDDFTRAIIDREVVGAARASGVRCTPVYPFMNGGATLNFMELAKLAGLAGRSIIGVVVNPVYGPWVAFRASILVDVDIDIPGEALGFDPCPTCQTRSCISSCPAKAVAFPAGWDIPRCLTHRVEVEADCAMRCHARTGCVLGPDHRYPEEELAYHQMRALRSMRPYYQTHIRRR